MGFNKAIYWKPFYFHVFLITFHPVCRVCLHQFQYMGKRYIARYCGGLVWMCIVLCITWIWTCGNCHLWWLAVGILVNSHDVFGLLPSNLVASFTVFPHSFCLILPHAHLLEGFPFVACCCTYICSPVFCSFRVPFLFSQVCLLALFSSFTGFAAPVWLSKVTFYHFFSQLRRYQFLT